MNIDFFNTKFYQFCTLCDSELPTGAKCIIADNILICKSCIKKLAVFIDRNKMEIKAL